MKASLDTNVIIHLYRANKQNIVFDLFDGGVFVDEFIYNIELQHHGRDVITELDRDIGSGRVVLVTAEWLRRNGIYRLYEEYYNEERWLYSSSDMGEVRAIALARTLGAVDVVTDDTKMYGPHASLMLLPDSDIIPFAYYEIIILLYLSDIYSADEAIEIFDTVQKYSPELTFSFKSKLRFFVKRFMGDPYTEREERWFKDFCRSRNIKAMAKLRELNRRL